MQGTVNWLMPLLLLPGVGLLLLSTSARFGQLHAEVHQLFHEEGVDRTPIAQHLLQRARLFRNALTALYASAALFAVGSIAGALMSLLGQGASDWLVFLFAALGAAFLVVATVLLVRESTLSLVIIEAHVEQLANGVSIRTH